MKTQKGTVTIIEILNIKRVHVIIIIYYIRLLKSAKNMYEQGSMLLGND